MKFNCNLQNLSGCPHEQDGLCRHPAINLDPKHCRWYNENGAPEGNGKCELAQ